MNASPIFNINDSIIYEIINDCNNDSRIYSDNEIARLTSLCIRSLVSSIDLEYAQTHEIIAIPKEKQLYCIALPPDGSKKEIEEQKKYAYSWINKYPFKYYNLGYDSQFIDLLHKNKIIVKYNCIQKHTELKISLECYAKTETSKIVNCNIKFTFRLGLKPHSCDNQAEYKELIEVTRNILIKYPEFLINNEGIFFSIDSDEIGWKLTDVQYEIS